jgi:hypothetical protein
MSAALTPYMKTICFWVGAEAIRAGADIAPALLAPALWLLATLALASQHYQAYRYEFI